jgi:hypothetical protein
MKLPVIIIILSITVLAATPCLSRPKISNYDLRFAFDFANKKLIADARLTITNLKPNDTLNVLLYRLLKIKAVKDESGKQIPFRQTVASFSDWDELQVNTVEIFLNNANPSPSQQTVQIEYEGHLFGYTETGMNYVKDNIDPNFTLLREDCYAYPVQGVASLKKNREAGFPDFNYTVTVRVPRGLRVVNGGKLISEKRTGELTEYVYASLKPSWRIDIAIGKYTTISNRNFYIHHFSEDSAGAHQVMNYLNKAVDCFTAWMGNVQFDSYSIIEIPDKWGSQTDVTCILQEASAFKSEKKLYELYHEISHIWNTSSTDKFPCRLESEGLAVFFQYLMMEKLHERTGLLDSSAKRTFLRVKSKLNQDSVAAITPIIDYGSRGLTDMSYTKGMLFFYLLYRTIGEDDFMSALKSYRANYSNGSSTREFADSLLSTSKNKKVRKLVNDWILTSESSKQITSGANIQALLP